MDLQRKAQENMVDQERKGMEFEERLDFDKMKLESAEDQAGERIRKNRYAKEKMPRNKKIKILKANVLMQKADFGTGVSARMQIWVWQVKQESLIQV